MAVDIILSRPDLEDYKIAQKNAHPVTPDNDNLILGPWRPQIEDPEALNAWSSRFTETLRYASPRIKHVVSWFGHTEVVHLAEVLQRRSSIDVTMGAILESTPPQPVVGLKDLMKQETPRPLGLTLKEALAIDLTSSH